MFHSEHDYENNKSQWVFPGNPLDEQAGRYILAVPQTHKVYVVSVFYITQ